MHWHRIETRRREYFPSALLLPLALLLVLALIKPVPVVGGITDDFKYFVGAQCLDCLPTNHWERRFAIVWPTGIAIQLLGQNMWSVMIFPIMAAVAAVVLTFKLVERQYGQRSALIAACVLVLTPIFVTRSMRIGIDIIELAFLLGSIFILQARKGPFWAGALLALAVLCRPTQLAALPMVAFLAWWLDRKSLKWFAAGFALPLLGEAAVYLVAAGDPLYPWKLSLNHVRVPSPFLSPPVDTTESPLFNPNYISGWVPVAGIETHWSVQGLINLMVSGEIGPTLLSALMISILGWKYLDRLQLALIACAVLFFGALTYGFAVDPRPRMFLPIAVVAAALIGSLAPKLWYWPKNVAVAVLVMLMVVATAVELWRRNDYRRDAEMADRLLTQNRYLITGVTYQRLALVRQDFPAGGTDVIHIDDLCRPRLAGRWLAHRDRNLCIYAGSSYAHQRTQLILSPLPEWIAQHPGQIETDPETRQRLNSLNEADELTGLDSNRPYLLYNAVSSCDSWLKRTGLQEGALAVAEETPNSRMAFLGHEWSGSYCLFRYERQVSASEVQAAIFRTRADKPVPRMSSTGFASGRPFRWYRAVE